MQLVKDYNEADLYYCECCGEFYDRKTHVSVNVPLSEIPADFALEVMAARQKSYKGRQKKRTAPKKTKGFGK
jgi:hypothetical protein